MPRAPPGTGHFYFASLLFFSGQSDKQRWHGVCNVFNQLVLERLREVVGDSPRGQRNSESGYTAEQHADPDQCADDPGATGRPRPPDQDGED